MVKKNDAPAKKPVREHIKDVQLADALSERYLAYAMSTIVARSLPDVRDGLKPVHRRILYAMRLLHLDPKSGYKKCARVVGDVMGRFHPHGDTAIYGTMVRLAQDFSSRYPMVEGQGNFGNIDGDGAAAMRYTEAKMTDYAMVMMDGLDEDAVEFVDNYDGAEREPALMPAAVPNLLANGSTGIAVGMATNIPPHNVAELCDALLALIKDPKIGDDALLEFVKGPDFPTGGIIVETKESLRKTYRSGRGSVKIRAAWAKEDLERGQYQIAVTQIPYQVQKSDLVRRIADLMEAKKLPFLADIRDESASDVRIVLEPKTRAVSPEALMEHLFKQSELEVAFNVNMNVLDKRSVPQVMSLKETLAAFLDHRMGVLERRGRARMAKVLARLEIVDGLLAAYLNLDAVIRIIRNEDEPKPVMMKKFKLTDAQAEAVLNMRLRALRKLEEQTLKAERKDLEAERDDLEAMFKSEKIRWSKITAELKDVRRKFAPTTKLGARRTTFGEVPAAADVPLESLIEKEPLTVVISQKGWIKAVKGLDADISAMPFKDGDALLSAVSCYTTDKILLFDTTGKFFTVGADRVPRGRGFGEPVRLLADIRDTADVVRMKAFDPKGKLLLASKSGRGMVVNESDVLAQTKTGRQVMNVGDGRAAFCFDLAGQNSVAVLGANRRLLVFKPNEIPVMQRGSGVILQKYPAGIELADLKLFNAADGLSYTVKNSVRIERNLAPWTGRRGGPGRNAPPLMWHTF